MRLTDTGDMEEPIGKLELTRWIASGLLVLIAILLLIAFVSNIFTGAEDQSYSAGVPAANWLGGLGVWLVTYVMNYSFGQATFLMPILIPSNLISKSTNRNRLQQNSNK